MLRQKKIKVIKRRGEAFPFSAPNLQTVNQGELRPKKVERELAERINDWVFDWRNRKRTREINDAAFLSK